MYAIPWICHCRTYVLAHVCAFVFSNFIMVDDAWALLISVHNCICGYSHFSRLISVFGFFFSGIDAGFIFHSLALLSRASPNVHSHFFVLTGRD